MAESKLTDLIAKLEAATEGSRELDAALMVAVQEIPAPRYGLREGFKQECRLGNDDLSVDVWTVGPGYEERYARYPAKPFTTSLDAIVALIERKLPGWERHELYNPNHGDHGCGYAGLTPPGGKSTNVVARNDKLALCSALLRALQL